MKVSMPSRAYTSFLLTPWGNPGVIGWHVSMPSRAWVVTYNGRNAGAAYSFQCPLGLELLRSSSEVLRNMGYVSMPSWAWVVTLQLRPSQCWYDVSMPSWAWVVTARMSNILNFSWYFLCIPAIYRCILAYLPIFFNQLSKFLRCESPSTFLGTCLSHHSFIIFLVTNTNTLLSGLYLISTKIEYNGNVFVANLCQCPLGLIPHFYYANGNHCCR